LFIVLNFQMSFRGCGLPDNLVQWVWEYFEFTAW